MFSIIIITLPGCVDSESDRIMEYIRRGYDIHIRKPEAGKSYVENLIRSIPDEYHHKLVLHDFYELAVNYHLRGIHLNSRNHDIPKRWNGRVSRSCHTFDEVLAWREHCDYVSLSPIFDSISKKGYRAAFSEEQLKEALHHGIINDKVYALGGVTFDKIEKVRQMGFGGAMILGDAWL